MVCQYYLSSRRTGFWLCWFLLWSLLFLLHISVLIFKISFLLQTLGFFISFFSSCFRCRVRLFIWLFSCFLRYACMNLPLSSAFTVSCRFWVVVFSFSFVYMHILISFFGFFCDLLVIQQRVVQPPYVGIFNSFSPVIEI